MSIFDLRLQGLPTFSPSRMVNKSKNITKIHFLRSFPRIVVGNPSDFILHFRKGEIEGIFTASPETGPRLPNIIFFHLQMQLSQIHFAICSPQYPQPLALSSERSRKVELSKDAKPSANLAELSFRTDVRNLFFFLIPKGKVLWQSLARLPKN
jgi:hypothetical protein